MEIVRNYNKTDLYCCFKFKCKKYHLKSNEFFFYDVHYSFVCSSCIIHTSMNFIKKKNHAMLTEVNQLLLARDQHLSELCNCLTITCRIIDKTLNDHWSVRVFSNTKQNS